MTNGWYVAGSKLSDVPTKDGFTFKEWTKDNQPVDSITGPGTYTATYEKNASVYNVNIDGLGSTDVTEGTDWSSILDDLGSTDVKYYIGDTETTSDSKVGDIPISNGTNITKKLKLTYSAPSNPAGSVVVSGTLNSTGGTTSLGASWSMWVAYGTEIEKGRIDGEPMVQVPGGSGQIFSNWDYGAIQTITEPMSSIQANTSSIANGVDYTNPKYLYLNINDSQYQFYMGDPFIDQNSYNRGVGKPDASFKAIDSTLAGTLIDDLNEDQRRAVSAWTFYWFKAKREENSYGTNWWISGAGASDNCVHVQHLMVDPADPDTGFAHQSNKFSDIIEYINREHKFITDIMYGKEGGVFNSSSRDVPVLSPNTSNTNACAVYYKIV